MSGAALRRALSIVQLVDNLDAGGLERMAIDLGVAHREAGHSSAIYCLGEAGALAPQARERGLAVTAFSKPPGIHLPTLWKLVGALRAQRPRVDVMHAHNPGNHHYATAAAKLAGVPVKGHAMLLAAFAELVKSMPDAELRIYGGGELQPSLAAEIARLGLEGRAFLPGETREVARVLAEADVFVFSSTSEGLPVVILEALASGLPVVSTRVGGVPEVAPEGEVAWYCEPGDAAAFAALMRTAFADRGELARRGRRARALAQEKYSIEACQARYEALYRELLARK